MGLFRLCAFLPDHDVTRLLLGIYPGVYATEKGLEVVQQYFPGEQVHGPILIQGSAEPAFYTQRVARLCI